MVKHLIKLLITLIFIPICSLAQQDSVWLNSVAKLKKVILAEKIDTTTQIAYGELAREYMYENPDSSLYFADISIQMAKELNRNDLKAYGYINKGYAYNGDNNFSDSKKQFEKALKVFEELNHKIGIAKSLNEIAFLQYLQGEYEEAIRLLNKVYKLELEIGNQSRAARTSLAIGAINSNLGNYPVAVSYLKKARTIQENLKDTIAMFTTDLQIGELHLILNDTLKAEKIYHQIISYDPQISQDDNQLNALLKLGIIASDRKEYKKALKFFKPVYKSAVNSKELLILSQVLNLQAYTYIDMDSLNIALLKANEAYKMGKEVDYKAGICYSLLLLGEIHHKKNNFTKSLNFYENAIQLSDEIKNPPYKSQALKGLSDLYSDMDNTKSALSFLKEYMDLKESLLNESKIQDITQTSLKYEFQQSQLEDSLLFVSEKATLENQIMLSNQRRNWLFGLLGILGLLIFQVIRNNRTRRLNNNLLNEKNNELSLKNKQNQMLLEEIHHRVKNNLQVISSLLSLQSNEIDDQVALDAVMESKNRVTSMALIHQKLYQGKDLTTIEMKDYFQTIGSAIIDSFGSKYEKVQLNINMEKVNLDVDTAVPIGLITTELMTNSLKYAFQNKEVDCIISINLKSVENLNLELNVKDNGEFSRKINDENSGFGSRLVKILTKQIEGSLEQETSNGTSTKIVFPFREKAIAA